MGADRLTEVALDDTPEPAQVLHVQRLVQSEVVAQGQIGLLVARVFSEDGHRRVPR